MLNYFRRNVLGLPDRNDTAPDRQTPSIRSEDTGLCRLCGGPMAQRFSLQVLRKHDVAYYECQECNSLQTEAPHWLGEAYDDNLSSLDTGALQRNLDNFAFCYTVAKLFSIKSAIDFGGGDGLLCRFLRDHSIDAYSYDKFAKSSYAQGFTTPKPGAPDLLTMFEVLEHLENPGSELEEVFSFNPKYLLCTTELYTGQDADWWYLAPQTGQHIFFYSPTAINYIADKFGYNVAPVGKCILFIRKDVAGESARSIAVAQEVLGGWIFQAIKAHVFTLPTPGSVSDFHLLSGKD